MIASATILQTIPSSGKTPNRGLTRDSNPLTSGLFCKDKMALVTVQFLLKY
jgi:hypothetical protein